MLFRSITGVYDLNGCVWEYVAGYIENTSGATNRNTYGVSVVANRNNQYATVYPHNSSSDSNTNNWTAYNGNSATRYGDAIIETSTAGSGSTSWNGDFSYFPDSSTPFFIRGGHYGGGAFAGVFAFGNYYGNSSDYGGFRAVLVPVAL